MIQKYFGFAYFAMTGLETSRHRINQSDAKRKSIMTWTFAFLNNLGALLLVTRLSLHLDRWHGYQPVPGVQSPRGKVESDCLKRLRALSFLYFQHPCAPLCATIAIVRLFRSALFAERLEQASRTAAIAIKLTFSNSSEDCCKLLAFMLAWIYVYLSIWGYFSGDKM